jgi:hypothetical protein
MDVWWEHPRLLSVLRSNSGRVAEKFSGHSKADHHPSGRVGRRAEFTSCARHEAFRLSLQSGRLFLAREQTGAHVKRESVPDKLYPV